MTNKRAGAYNLPRYPSGGTSGLVAMAFLLTGWLLAVLFGHGWELHRIILAVPFAAAGTLLACIEILRGRVVVWKPALLLLAAGSLYFFLRASFSPVSDFGRADVLLVTLFAMCFLGGAACLRSHASLTLLLKAMILVFAGHLLIGLFQRLGDPSFAVFRLPRSDQAGVSGLFWHRNYLAGMLELMVPVFAAVLVTSRTIGWRIMAGLVVVLGLLLLFLTKSRGGLMATMIGVGTVGALVVLAKSTKWTMNKRMAAIAAAIVAAVGIGWIGISTSARVAEERGQSGDIEEALSVNGRLAFAGMAFDQWTEQPVFGTGSRSFSYKAPEHWGNAGSWIGDPVMVHNDYMQVLAEYGAVGIILVMSFAVALLIRGYIAWRHPEVRKTDDDDEDESDDGLARGLMIGAMGALVASMLHGVIDFSLHILPNLMLFGLLVGFLAQPNASDEASRRRSPGLILTAVGLLVMSSAVAFAAGWRELSISPQWLAWERDLIRREGAVTMESLDTMGTILQAAPSFSLARSYGRVNLDAYRQDPAAQAHRLDLSEEGFRLAAERNRFDGETLANIAFILELKGRFEEATGAHLAAVDRTWRRELKYGAMAALAANLTRRGEELLYRGEKSRALGFYERALEYLDASRQTGFRGGGTRESLRFRAEIAARIETLQSEGIELQFPENVPPPPR